MPIPTAVKSKKNIHHCSPSSVTGGHKKILATLVSVVFSGLIFTTTLASAAPKYPCENLSAKDCYKMANSWAFPGELNNGLRGLKAELALAKTNKDEKRYSDISSIYKKMGSKYSSLKSKAKAEPDADSKGSAVSSKEDPMADEKGTSKYSAALEESRNKLEAELKRYNSLMSKHLAGRPGEYDRLVLVGEKNKGP